MNRREQRVEITGLDDKCQITALLSCTMDGKLLPTQVIYAGKHSKIKVILLSATDAIK